MTIKSQLLLRQLRDIFGGEGEVALRQLFQASPATGGTSLQDGLERLLGQIDDAQRYPTAIAEGPRGRTSGGKWVSLPDGWLDSRELAAGTDLSAAEIGVSGG